MDQAWEIVGIVIAILMIIIGLRWLLKKPQTVADVKVEDLQIEDTSQQPIMPRHVREAMLTKLSSSATQESTPDSVQTETAQQVADVEKVVSAPVESTADSKEQVQKTDLDALKAELEDEKELLAEAEQLIKSENAEQPKQDDNASPELTGAKVALEKDADETDTTPEKEEMQALDLSDEDWKNESTVFDAHLSEQDRHDEESTLATAKKIVAFYVYPNPERALSGERTLKMLLKYGLRYGEMACFHRYEHAEQVSPLLFSVLRIQEDGAPTGFDLEALPTEEVKGLAFFLALPNPHALQGFDTMASTAMLMGRDIEGRAFDENGLELTQQLRDHLRHQVIEYDPNQIVD